MISIQRKRLGITLAIVAVLAGSVWIVVRGGEVNFYRFVRRNPSLLNPIWRVMELVGKEDEFLQGYTSDAWNEQREKTPGVDPDLELLKMIR